MAYPPAGPQSTSQPQAWAPGQQGVPPQQGGRGSGRSRPSLPRLVDQMRVLLWFQFFLTLVLFLAVLIGTASINDVYGDSGSTRLEDHLWTLMLMLLGTTVIQALAAGLLRHGWAVLAPLVLVSQLAVLADLGWCLYIGTFGAFGACLLVLLGGWILADLFRGEVRRYLFGPKQRP